MKTSTTSSVGRVLITGGAGFIGTNLADRLALQGHPVTIYDNFSRVGVEGNASWLKAKHGSKIRIERADVRDSVRVAEAISEADQVFHFAAQAAVTSSISDPRYDFEVNLGGTINILEAIRRQDHSPTLIFTSTNKVYGALTDISLETVNKRYQPENEQLRRGISETRPLDFHSPYGCSKGAADQYVLDYARTFGLQALVFRMSCIYGPHQLGNEDQGWIAHFLLNALHDETITICGDGFQVRDVLYVDDLIDAFLAAQENIEELSGNAFNIGGGCANATSLLELIDLINSLQPAATKIRMDDWRLGDQRYYVSDTAKFRMATGWAPQVTMRDGVSNLYEWLMEQREPSTDLVKGGRHAVLTR